MWPETSSGSWIAYGIGYYGRIELLERHGKWLHIGPAQIAWADRWFERYGDATVFFSRMLPVIRTFISLPAGVARMPFWRFTLLSVAGIIPWVLAWAIVGKQVGGDWDNLQEKLHYFDYAIVAADRRRDCLPDPEAPRRAGGDRVGRTLSDERLPLAHAVALGAIQGPAELLPVSSSGHLVLVPAMLGWRYRELDAEIRKSVEVALHAGGAVALVIGLRKEVAEYLRTFRLHNLASLTLSFAPAALIALRFERPIERRLSEPRPVALALLAGSAAMAIADGSPETRRREEASLKDALVIGFAQAFALAPGVSRNGATLAAARWRGFRRADANVISRQIALPVIVGASVLKGARLGAKTSRRESPREWRPAPRRRSARRSSRCG